MSSETLEAVTAAARSAIAEHVRLVQDFPAPGVAFKDLSPVLADPAGFARVVAALARRCEGAELVAGLDARGFLLGGAVAFELGVGVLAVRKGGKLPPPVIGVDYQLEYGSARLELPAEGLTLAGRRVAMVDDVLATGGTAVAAAELLGRCGADLTDIAVVMELSGLPGRDRIVAGIGEHIRVHSLTEG